MTKRYYKFLLLFLFLSKITGQEIDYRIIGGEETTINQYPFIVSIQSTNAILSGPIVHEFDHSGIILNELWIVTAAHLFPTKYDNPNFNIEQFTKINAGITNRFDESSGQIIDVDEIIVHPGFSVDNPLNGNDIALIRLKEPLCFNQNVQPISYMKPSDPQDLVSIGHECTVLGWGPTVIGSNDKTDILRKLVTQISDKSIANTALFNNCGIFGQFNKSITTFIQNKSAAPGDSGGPLVTTYLGSPILIGIVSGGCIENPIGSPTVYTSVQDFTQFIESHIIPIVLPTTYISSETIIENEFKPSGNIYLHGGAQLWVKGGVIKMRAGSKIIVNRNSRLKITEGGKITASDCPPEVWDGIKLSGNWTMEQPAKDAPLNNPDQGGIVWIDQGIIEKAGVAISTDKFGSCGLIDAETGIFEQNQIAINFGYCPNIENKSKFKECHFVSWGTSFPNTEGVVINSNKGIIFDNCQFYYLDQDAIRSYGSEFKVINGTHINHTNTGILAYSLYPSSSFVQIGQASGPENKFEDNEYHILAHGTSGVLTENTEYSLNVINNNFKNGKFGVFASGGSNYKIAGNLFENTFIGNMVSQTGFNSLFNNNLIGCNNFKNSKSSGIIAIGNNKQMQFLSNKFTTSLTGYYDFLLSSPFFNPSIPGEIAGNQGATNLPAKNCFTNPGSSIVDIGTLNQTVPFNFYHKNNTPGVCNEEPLNPGNYLKKLIFPISDGIDCNAFGGLPFNTPNPTITDLIARRTLISSLLPVINTNETARNQYYQALQEKEVILKELLRQSLASHDYTMAETLLMGEQSIEGQWAIYGLRLQRNDVAGATQFLNTMTITDPMQQELKDIQVITLQYLSNPMEFQLTTSQDNFLSTIANTGSPNSGYAQALLSLLKGNRYYPTIPNFSGPRAFNAELSSVKIRLSPIPVNNELQIEFLQKSDNVEGKLLIYNLLGKLNAKYHINEQDLNNTIDVSTLLPGVYFLKYEENGKTVGTEKFIKQ